MIHLGISGFHHDFVLDGVLKYQMGALISDWLMIGETILANILGNIGEYHHSWTGNAYEKIGKRDDAGFWGIEFGRFWSPKLLVCFSDRRFFFVDFGWFRMISILRCRFCPAVQVSLCLSSQMRPESKNPQVLMTGSPRLWPPFKIQENQHMDSFFLAKPHFLGLWRFSLLINTHVDCGCFWNPTHHDAFPLLQ